MKGWRKGSTGLGGASLLLVFTVVCLAAFGALSLSSAQADARLAQRSAEAVTAYYAADSEGEQALMELTQAARAAMKTGEESWLESLAQACPQWQAEGEIFSREIPMEGQQVLHIRLRVCYDKDTPVQVECWQVENRGEFIPDDSLELWEGEFS